MADKARRRAHWLFPNTIKAYDKDETAYRENRERESNEESRLPVDEALNLLVMWGMELFGPAEIERLYKSLARLNWSAGYGREKSEDALSWVRHQRAYGGSGASYNVGIVSNRSNPQRGFMCNNFAALPAEVDYLLVQILQLTPSLTCILIGYVFKEEASRCYEVELSRDRKTLNERSGSRWIVSSLEPGHLKKRAIEQVRLRMQTLARQWFHVNLPGFFRGQPGRHLPTAELVTTRAQALLWNGNHASHTHRLDWRHLVANASPFNIWTSAQCPALGFTEVGDRFFEDAHHLVVALHTTVVPEDSLGYSGGRTNESYARHSHDAMGEILSHYAGLAFLKEVSKELKMSRAKLKNRRFFNHSSASVLERIQSFFDRSLGTPVVATELQDRSKSAALYQGECSRFMSPKWLADAEQQDFAKMLCEQTHFLAARVIAEEIATREHFTQLASILSVRESIKTQCWMWWLAVFAFVVTASSLIVAIYPKIDWPAKLLSWLV
jgi:hypothetical protein